MKMAVVSYECVFILHDNFSNFSKTIYTNGENLCHDKVLITINIFSIKRKLSTRLENQLHLRSYKADFNAIRSS